MHGDLWGHCLRNCVLFCVFETECQGIHTVPPAATSIVLVLLGTQLDLDETIH